MIKSNNFKLVVSILTISMFTLFSSCAQYSRRPNSYHSTTNNKSNITPSQEINNYKYNSQKRDLDSVISEDKVKKPSFLKRIKNKKIDFWIGYFSGKGKDRFERYLVNGERYRGLIENILDDYGLPKELYFVGLIESGYYLKAKSTASAVGPWQFIRSTGKRYGLRISRDIDERQNIVKATQAAALFFQDLYNIFGSWELALSAYNAGEYGIIRRIRKANTRDFYELSRRKKLPKETINYVPKVIAAMTVYNNARKYNITIPKYGRNVFNNITKENIRKSTTLASISRRTKVSIKTIKALNADIKRNYIPRLSKGFDLILPKGNYSLKNLKTYKVPASASRISAKKIHKVRSGDSLIRIARRYQTSISKIKRLNRLRNNKIFIGQKIKIPSQRKIRSISSVKKTNGINKYLVRRGDNLHRIAIKNHTSISKILKLNKLKKRTIYIGQVLKLPAFDAQTYTVRNGDYLLKIAQKHGLTVAKLKKLNDIRNSKIYPGQRLIISVN